jgi:protein-L-isoaspartate(D-aspartate) O-methyltransferase
VLFVTFVVNSPSAIFAAASPRCDLRGEIASAVGPLERVHNEQSGLGCAAISVVEYNPGIKYALLSGTLAIRMGTTFMVVDYTQLRERMVQEQLMLRGINDPRVLWAMAKVPRHLFVDNEFWDRAYDDGPLPIGESQTISQPYMVALTAEALRLTGTEKVLEVGTGSGYAAAVLAELCAEVFTVEAVETLASKARTILAGLGYRNVSVLLGDGTLGWEEHAPYDAIAISAAAPCIPRPLVSQLRTPGYLVLPMGEKELQTLVRIRKDAEGIREEYLGECRFVKLKGKYGWEDDE